MRATIFISILSATSLMLSGVTYFKAKENETSITLLTDQQNVLSQSLLPASMIGSNDEQAPCYDSPVAKNKYYFSGYGVRLAIQNGVIHINGNLATITSNTPTSVEYKSGDITAIVYYPEFRISVLRDSRLEGYLTRVDSIVDEGSL